jgi:hypothetical protein
MVPDLVKLYDETAPKGLVWLGVDNDENPEAQRNSSHKNISRGAITTTWMGNGSRIPTQQYPSGRID